MTWPLDLVSRRSRRVVRECPAVATSWGRRSRSVVPRIGSRLRSWQQCVEELASRCTIRVRACWPGGSAGVWLPCGGAVGDQSGDGQGGVFEVLAAPYPAVQGPPLLGFGDGVLDADPLGGLLVALLVPAGGLFRGPLTWPGKSRARPW